MQAGDLDVLIVDDHEAMRMLLARVLNKLGVRQIRAAESGAAALAALGERPASLVLADRNMPGMDGFSLVRNIRADPRLGTPRIIMISGNAGGGHEDAARAAGVDMVLVKPVTGRDLVAAIEVLFAV
ncbi:MAG: response regulator [Hyphomonadaceae bacterium]|nr:response regulator [Hyphomonadaceae bacterium]